MGIREDFYTALGEQFIDDPSGSFLFHFLREERLRKKTDKTFAQASLDELLGLLADRNQKLQLNEEDRTWILALTVRFQKNVSLLNTPSVLSKGFVSSPSVTVTGESALLSAFP